MNKIALKELKNMLKKHFNKRLESDILPRAKYLNEGDIMEIEYKVKVDYEENKNEK